MYRVLSSRLNSPVQFSNVSSLFSRSFSSIVRTASGLYVDKSLPPSFDKILIANRGEIACRVMRTARELGIKTVAVYSEVDARSMHVQMADEAYYVGPAAARESYLRGDKIIDIAKKSGAQAIHPGYGFLSENAGFAKMCESAKVEFIGPPSSAIEAMGSKSASKHIMSSSNVPVVPGYHEEDQSIETLTKEANRVGYPIMIKAVLGGGGKGMRIVHRAEDLAENIAAAKREAQNSFNDSRVLLERYISRPRHIEFQVFADKFGNTVHLFERDCSVQRRHQKVLEESPAPGMSQELRATMGKSAVDAARAVGYVGAGTVEFIFDADTGEYFFMEMNTRLQVEHPVTEMVTGRDLVQWQLHVAAGHRLPFTQEQVSSLRSDGVNAPFGHAIEARIYAENPNNNFLPCTGKLHHLKAPPLPSDASMRVETGVRPGDDVSIFYDPMISKLVVWASDRQRALMHMSRALSQYEIIGPPTNIPFVIKCVNHPQFQHGQVTTQFIAENKDNLLSSQQDSVSTNVVALASLWLMHALKQNKTQHTTDVHSPWDTSLSTRFNLPSNLSFHLTQTLPKKKEGEEEKIAKIHVQVTVPQHTHAPFTAQVKVDSQAAVSVEFNGEVTIDQNTNESHHQTNNSAQLHARINQQAYIASVVQTQNDISLFVDGQQTKFTLPTLSFGSKAHEHGTVSPMAGKIVKVMTQARSQVTKGTPLVIMEAMKMEHVIRAPRDGVVESVMCQEGDFVEGGKVLVNFVETADKK